MVKFGYKAGTSGTVTITAGVVLAWSAISTGGGSVTIAPGGPGNPAPVVDGDSIPLPAGVPIGRDYRTNADRSLLPQLGPGTVFKFTSTDSYYIELGS